MAGACPVPIPHPGGRVLRGPRVGLAVQELTRGSPRPERAPSSTLPAPGEAGLEEGPCGPSAPLRRGAGCFLLQVEALFLAALRICNGETRGYFL